MTSPFVTSNAAPPVGIVMGSRSDWDTMKPAADRLDQLGVPYEVRVVSAHRTPDVLFDTRNYCFHILTNFLSIHILST